MMEIVTKIANSDDRDYIRALESILQSRTEFNFVDLLFKSMATGERNVIIGFIDGLAAGYVVLNWTPTYNMFARLSIPELQDLNVLPDVRRHGLGTALVEACENLARTRNYSEIGLAVGLTQSYGAAQRLYVRMGYMPDGQGVSYDRQNVKPGDKHFVDDDLCLMMVKSL